VLRDFDRVSPLISHYSVESSKLASLITHCLFATLTVVKVRIVLKSCLNLVFPVLN
jgi:hypothetical protein